MPLFAALLIFVTLHWGARALARVEVLTEISSAQETHSYYSESTIQKTVTSAGVYMGINQAATFRAGFEYLYLTGNAFTDAGQEVTYATTAPLLGVQVRMGPNGMLRGYLGYAPVISSDISPATGGAEKWTGSGFQFRGGVVPKISDNLNLLLAVTYANYTFPTKSGGSSTVTEFSHTYLSPSVGLVWDMK